MNVVVVESPAKAKTIEKYLGADYKVLASYGHICDLPSKDGSVRPDEDFGMDYVSNAKSARHLKAIVDAARDADQVLLATDPDREGEAISWHVMNYLHARRGLADLAMQRVVFHEITRDAVIDRGQQSARYRHGPGQRPASAPGARLFGRLYAVAGVVAQGARQPIGRACAVGALRLIVDAKLKSKPSRHRNIGPSARP